MIYVHQYMSSKVLAIYNLLIYMCLFSSLHWI